MRIPRKCGRCCVGDRSHGTSNALAHSEDRRALAPPTSPPPRRRGSLAGWESTPGQCPHNRRMILRRETPEVVEKARVRFVKKWRLRCPPVITSFDEASDELFTFLRFPPMQWKGLRTTNALERINEEFRRRTKTQGSCRAPRRWCSCSSARPLDGRGRLRAAGAWSLDARRQLRRRRPSC